MRIFATCSQDGQVNMYNIISGVHLRTLFHPKNYPIKSVFLSSSPVPCIVIYS